MGIYYLILWSVTIQPFEAGQYTTRERCEAAAQVQVIGLHGAYGPGRLQWKCELKITS